MNRRELLATGVSLFVPQIVTATNKEKSIHENGFYNHEYLLELLQVAGTKTFNLNKFSDSTIKEIFERIYIQICYTKDIITKKIKVSPSELWLVTNPKISSVFECSCAGFYPKIPNEQLKGIIRVGVLNNTWTLYKDTNFPENKLLMGLGKPPKKLSSKNCGFISINF